MSLYLAAADMATLDAAIRGDPATRVTMLPGALIR